MVVMRVKCLGTCKALRISVCTMQVAAIGNTNIYHTGRWEGYIVSNLARAPYATVMNVHCQSSPGPSLLAGFRGWDGAWPEQK